MGRAAAPVIRAPGPVKTPTASGRRRAMAAAPRSQRLPRKMQLISPAIGPISIFRGDTRASQWAP
jgi:hypothetical protein